jgi:hypothetical protein
MALEVGVDQGHRVSGFLILFVHAWWDSLGEWLERCKVCTCIGQLETRNRWIHTRLCPSGSRNMIQWSSDRSHVTPHITGPLQSVANEPKRKAKLKFQTTPCRNSFKTCNSCLSFPKIVEKTTRSVLRSALLWTITQRVVVIPYRRFGTTYRPHLPPWPLKIRSTRSPETSVRNYHYLPRNSPEERSSHLLRCRRVK